MNQKTLLPLIAIAVANFTSFQHSFFGGTVALGHQDHHTASGAHTPVKAVAKTPAKPAVDPRYNAFAKPMKLFPFEVQALDQSKLTHESMKGRWSLLTFGFTSCPDVCPLTMTRLKRELNKLPADVSSKIAVYFATLDPEHDNPKALGSYINSWKIKVPIIGLYSSKDVMEKLARQFAPVSKEPAGASGANLEIVHSGGIFVINPQGEIQGYFVEEGAGEKMADTLKRFVKSS